MYVKKEKSEDIILGMILTIFIWLKPDDRHQAINSAIPKVR